MSVISIGVRTKNGEEKLLEVPIDIGLNLMEFLKASNYDIQATCGGMALCATCHVSIEKGIENLNEITDDESAILDTLPGIRATSRLSCQIKLNSEKLHGMSIEILGDQ